MNLISIGWGKPQLLNVHIVLHLSLCSRTGATFSMGEIYALYLSQSHYLSNCSKTSTNIRFDMSLPLLNSTTIKYCGHRGNSASRQKYMYVCVYVKKGLIYQT